MKSEDTPSAADQLASLSLGGSFAGESAEAPKAKRLGNFAMAVEGDEMVFCSNCGKTGDTSKLKGCNGCRCIRYCSASCQKTHWKAHKKECKRIQAVLKTGPTKEGRYERYVDLSVVSDDDAASGLFDDPMPQPDCDICMIRLPLNSELNAYASCCGKIVCCGCKFDSEKAWNEKNKRRAKKSQPPLEQCCPFCRENPGNNELKSREKRAIKGDPNAIYSLACFHRDGALGLPVNEAKAVELAKKAADLGNMEAQAFLGQCYAHGELGLEADKAKSRMYYELAAKSGDVRGRYHLGWVELKNENYENTVNAIRHWRIAAAAGLRPSVSDLIICFNMGLIRHEDLAPSLRARDKAELEMKSESRDRYIEHLKSIGEYDEWWD